MAPSKEVADATGAAPSAAEQLEQKQRDLRDAETALAAAESAMDTHRVIALQNEVAVLRRFIERLAASVAVEAAAEAREEATALDAQLRARYADKLAQLMPDIEQARLAIKAMTDSVRKCARTWSAAQRAGFEVQLNAMRFGREGPPLATLPASPIDAVTAAFWEEIDKMDRLCRRDTLPTVLAIASDTDAQRRVKAMTAAAAFVETYGKDLKLCGDLLSVFAKAGPVSVAAAAPRGAAMDDDRAFIPGEKPMPLPAGAVQSALGPSNVWEPDTEQERAERERIRRSNARRQADVARELGEEAKTVIAEREALQGPLKGRPLKGLR